MSRSRAQTLNRLYRLLAELVGGGAKRRRQRRWLHDALALSTRAHPWLTHLSDGRAAINTSDP